MPEANVAEGGRVAIASARHRGVELEIPGSAFGSASEGALGNQGAPWGAQANWRCPGKCS